MRLFFLASVILLAATPSILPAAPAEFDASRIKIFVAPYYDSEGPTVDAGRFSAGLASTKEEEFLATLAQMSQEWSRLTFTELYIAAIRLYDLGYRQESVYWFYSAQFRGRQFAALLDQSRMGSLGEPGFEWFHAQNAFLQLAGPYINGYAFGNPTALALILERVQTEGTEIPGLETLYPGVVFRPRAEWNAYNEEMAQGMGQLISMLRDNQEDIKRQRLDNGIEDTFSKLPNKDLPPSP